TKGAAASSNRWNIRWSMQRMKHSSWTILVFSIAATWGAGQEVRGPVKVTIKDGRTVVGEPILPLDPTVRITPQHSGQNSFGLTVEGKRITCSPQGSIWQTVMVDGNIFNPFASPENVQPR